MAARESAQADAPPPWAAPPGPPPPRFGPPPTGVAHSSSPLTPPSPARLLAPSPPGHGVQLQASSALPAAPTDAVLSFPLTPPPPPTFSRLPNPPPPTFSSAGTTGHGHLSAQRPAYGENAESREDMPAVISVAPETTSSSSTASPQYSEQYSSPIIALDPYSVPTISLPSDPPKPPSYFDIQKDGIGEAIYASDLTRDDMEGIEVSSQFVAFSAGTVHNQRKVTNIASLGFGALASPVREVNPPPPFLRNKPVRCEFCGAYANLYCPLLRRSGEWKCIFCGKGNDSRGEYLLAEGEDYSSWPELSSRVVDYLEGGTRRYSSASDTALAVPIVFVIDETLDQSLLGDLQTSLLDVIETLPPATRIGLLSYGRTVSVYDLNQPGAASADVFPGTASLSAECKNNLIYGSGMYLAPIHACLPVAKAVISALRPYKGAMPELDRKRCLGVAVEVALTLVRGPATDLPRIPMKRTGGSSRVVVCAGGPTTLGPGSVDHPEGHSNFAYEQVSAKKHMEALGREARRLEAAVDILFGGTCPVMVPVVHALTSASGGVLIMHDDFREAFSANVRGAISRVVGVRGSLEVRTSPSMTVTRVIGPAGAAPEAPGEPPFPNDTSTVLEMLSVEEGQGLALSMELLEDVPDDFLYFQFAMRYTSVNQATIIRVITLRLITTGNVSTYLQSVDEEVAAVLIGKRTVLAAEKASDLPQVCRSVGERVKDLAQKFGKAMPRSRLQRCPNELSRLVETLYHLHRGPLLGGIVGHEDERAVLRSLFLRADLYVALRMLLPQLLLFRQGVGLQEIPPYDLALHSENALVMDHGTDIFTWMGANLAADPVRRAAADAACKAVVEELSRNRFPSPRCLSFREGTSPARYLVSRLIPAHRDSPADQETRFPPLRELRPDERNRLKANLPPTDETSFCEWLRSLRLVPPDPNPVR